MKFEKIMDQAKKVNWVDLGVTAVGVLGLVLGSKQKKQDEVKMNETIQKKVQEAVDNLK